MKYIPFLLIVLIVISCQQHQEKKANVKDSVVKLPPPPKVIDEKTLIGFACYYGGIRSEAVNKVTEILIKKDYSKLKAKLFDVNPAEKYLATVACEKLEIKNLIKFTDDEIVQIGANKISNEKVTICDGCTNEEELMLKQMFTAEENFLATSVQDWINETIK